VSRNPSRQALAVLHALCEVPGHRLYGLQIIAVSGLASGTVHPILARLERDGLAKSKWEDSRTAFRQRRPQRRFYTLTPDGVEFSRDRLSELPECSYCGGKSCHALDIVGPR
jgi:hypothetical protein